MIKVYEVNTVERVERRYLVQFTTADVAQQLGQPIVDDEDCKVYAEELVATGEANVKFTEGNAEIEEVLSVKEQK